MTPNRKKRILKGLPDRLPGWIGFGFLLVAAICLTGGLIGSLVYPAVGLLIGKDLTVVSMMRFGFADGAFWALIWAPGLSIVACIAGAYEKRRNVPDYDS
jgi:hypothetical protein